MLATIGKFILDYLVSKLVGWVTALANKLMRRKEVEKQSEESVIPLEKADPESEKEIDDATRSALDGL